MAKKKRPTDLLFGNLLDEFGDAAAPIIRRVMASLGIDADEQTVRRAVAAAAPKPKAKPKAKKPLAAKKPPRRTMTQTPDLRAMSTEDAVRTARSEPHLIQDASGQYVGAPRGVTSLEDLGVIRSNFDLDVAQGAEGADWYTRARASNVDLAGPDPARQRLLAQEQALWSAQANPDTNLNFALQGHNAYEMGVPLDKVRTGQQARTYREARDAGVDIPLGKKTGVYGQHLDPTVPYATTGTNDIWHSRGLGYTNADGTQFSRALTPQEHRFVDYETMLAVDRANAAKLAGRDDWLAHEIQAAPWVAGKGRSLAQQIAGKGNEPTPEQMAEGLRRASMTYPDYLPKYTANATYEQVPYSASGHLEGIGTGSESVRRAYSENPALSWTGNSDRDMLYDLLGAYQQPTISATGVYTPPGGAMETNPAFVARPLVGLSEGDVDPASRGMLDFAEMLRGYIGGQGASAWNTGMTNVKLGEQNALRIPTQGASDLATLQQLGELGSAYGLPDFLDTGRAAVLTNFDFENAPSGVQVGKALRSGLADDIAALTGSRPQRMKMTGSYLPILEAGRDPRQGVPGSGFATDELLALADKYPVAASKLESPLVQNRALSQANLDEQLSSRYGATREDLQTARRIFAERGFEGLREARRQGIALPGIAALMGLYGLQADEGDAGY